ncbi:hypothetical protein GJ744_011719 [Endocarpon pusillum]|uniref:Uncharacterized protein n=1 Tax=Endocarpon pusillum TaxID=364733 RepID=A0A8H7E0W1_9EURO|nr:hypothetical protein GJ744_011719 [Endocarpon pusillum]
MDVEGGLGVVVVDIVEGRFSTRQGVAKTNAAPDAEPSPGNLDVVNFQGKEQGVLQKVRKFGAAYNSGLEEYQHKHSTWLVQGPSSVTVGHIPHLPN